MVGIARRPPLLPTGSVGLGSALGAWTGQGVPDRSFSRVSGLAISQPQPRTDIELKRQSCQCSICSTCVSFLLPAINTEHWIDRSSFDNTCYEIFRNRKPNFFSCPSSSIPTLVTECVINCHNAI